MNPDINAWKEIGRWLKIRRRPQSDLAACLGISASAVTQIKKGGNQLSAEQLRTFLEYLAVDESAAEEICCTTIFQARLGNALPKRTGKLHLVENADPRCSWPMEFDGCRQRLIPQIPLRRLR